jgi:hypothetical protein
MKVRINLTIPFELATFAKLNKINMSQVLTSALEAHRIPKVEETDIRILRENLQETQRLKEEAIKNEIDIKNQITDYEIKAAEIARLDEERINKKAQFIKQNIIPRMGD